VEKRYQRLRPPAALCQPADNKKGRGGGPVNSGRQNSCVMTWRPCAPARPGSMREWGACRRQTPRRRAWQASTGACFIRPAHPTCLVGPVIAKKRKGRAFATGGAPRKGRRGCGRPRRLPARVLHPAQESRLAVAAGGGPFRLWPAILLQVEQDALLRPRRLPGFDLLAPQLHEAPPAIGVPVPRLRGDRL